MSGDSNVKSKAIVKFDAFKPLETFKRLEPETNLHEPPQDWLREEPQFNFVAPSTPAIPKQSSHHDQEGSQQQDLSLVATPGSSFQMAFKNLDVVGDVDVIAHADVIKKLLRLPFDKRQLSVVVHRIGKTLLLDEFDILALLIATEEVEWQWIRDFVQNHILSDLKQKNIHIRKPYGKSTPAALEHNMLSKFLHYSVPKMLGSQNSFSEEESLVAPPSEDEILNLPEPVLESGTDVRGSSRTVLWEFENMQMLLGSNLPIFGGTDHPVVSLRLHDASKPINVLTGLDYWLDNLICNVPELAMCYHINGIVQKYEVYKTMDIPNLENSKFRPTAIRDIAQNILSFLNNNCAKEGHTYWLFKPHGDEIVKLYDLTSICDTANNSGSSGDAGSEDSDAESPQPMQNPFSIPVAFLLYRVAKKLVAKFSQDNERSAKIRATVYSLLRNALKLIDDVRVRRSNCASSGSGSSSNSGGNNASASGSGLDPQCRDLEGCIFFLLVQLYIPSGPWKDWAAGMNDDNASNDEKEDFGSESGDDSSITSEQPEEPTDVHQGISIDKETFLKSGSANRSRLLKEHRKAHEFSKLDLSVEERCRSALEYTLKCFQFLQQYQDEPIKKTPQKEPDLNGDKKSTHITLKSNEPWRDSVRCSLLYKLAVILSNLGLQCFDNGKYGRAFRYLKLALASCCSIGKEFLPQSKDITSDAGNDANSDCIDDEERGGRLLLGKILQLLGDVFVLFASNCTNSIDQTELNIEEATKGHTVIELQLACYLTPNNNELYAKTESFCLCGEYSICIESAVNIYLLCQDYMKSVRPTPPKLNMSNTKPLPYISPPKHNNANTKEIHKRRIHHSNQNSSSSVVPKNTNHNHKMAADASQASGAEETSATCKRSMPVINVQEWAYCGEGQLLKRLGNVNNEMGKMHENKLMEITSQISENFDLLPEAEKALYYSKSFFEKACLFFTQIGDRANVGLVLSNTGRLCRIWAHILRLTGSKGGRQLLDSQQEEEDKEKRKESESVEKSSGEGGGDAQNTSGVSSQEKSYYYKAIDYYKQSLSHLEAVTSAADQTLLNNVTWDLCSTYFTLAQLLHENTFSASKGSSTTAHHGGSETKQEVVELFTKALKYCIPPQSNLKNATADSKDQSLFLKERHLKRLGEIHQKLGSVYHHTLRYEGDAGNTAASAMAQFHYSKAADCFNVNLNGSQGSLNDMGSDSSVDAVIEGLQSERDELFARVQLERVALIEVQLGNASATKRSKSSTEMYRTAILYLCEAFESLHRLSVPEDHPLCDVFTTQTRKILLSCIKFTATSANSVKQKQSSQKSNEVTPQSEDRLKSALKDVYGKSLKFHKFSLVDWKIVFDGLKSLVPLLINNHC